MHLFILDSDYKVIKQYDKGYLMQYSDNVDIVFFAIQGATEDAPEDQTATLYGTPSGSTTKLMKMMNWDSYEYQGNTLWGWSAAIPNTFTQVAGPIVINASIQTGETVAFTSTIAVTVNGAGTGKAWDDAMNYAEWKELTNYFLNAAIINPKNFVTITDGQTITGEKTFYNGLKTIDEAGTIAHYSSNGVQIGGNIYTYPSKQDATYTLATTSDVGSALQEAKDYTDEKTSGGGGGGEGYAKLDESNTFTGSANVNTFEGAVKAQTLQSNALKSNDGSVTGLEISDASINLGTNSKPLYLYGSESNPTYYAPNGVNSQVALKSDLTAYAEKSAENEFSASNTFTYAEPMADGSTRYYKAKLGASYGLQVSDETTGNKAGYLPTGMYRTTVNEQGTSVSVSFAFPESGGTLATQSWVNNQGFITDTSGMAVLASDNTFSGINTFNGKAIFNSSKDNNRALICNHVAEISTVDTNTIYSLDGSQNIITFNSNDKSMTIGSVDATPGEIEMYATKTSLSGKLNVTGDTEVGGTFKVNGVSNFNGKAVFNSTADNDISLLCNHTAEISTLHTNTIYGTDSGNIITYDTSDHGLQIGNFINKGDVTITSNKTTIEGASKVTGDTELAGTLTVGGVTNFNGKAVFNSTKDNDISLLCNHTAEISTLHTDAFYGTDSNNIITYDKSDYGLTIGGLINKGDINVLANKTTFEGDVVVTGTFTKVNAETLSTKQYTIELAKDNTTALTSYVGLYVKKYDGTNTGGLMWNNMGTAFVGDCVVGDDGKPTDVSNMQPILTRSDTTQMTADALLSWDATNLKAVTAKKDGTALTTSYIATTKDLESYAKLSDGGTFGNSIGVSQQVGSTMKNTSTLSGIALDLVTTDTSTSAYAKGKYGIGYMTVKSATDTAERMFNLPDTGEGTLATQEWVTGKGYVDSGALANYAMLASNNQFTGSNTFKGTSKTTTFEGFVKAGALYTDAIVTTNNKKAITNLTSTSQMIFGDENLSTYIFGNSDRPYYVKSSSTIPSNPSALALYSDLSGYAKTTDLSGYAKLANDVNDFTGVAKFDGGVKTNVLVGYTDTGDAINIAQCLSGNGWNFYGSKLLKTCITGSGDRLYYQPNTTLPGSGTTSYGLAYAAELPTSLTTDEVNADCDSILG